MQTTEKAKKPLVKKKERRKKSVKKKKKIKIRQIKKHKLYRRTGDEDKKKVRLA